MVVHSVGHGAHDAARLRHHAAGVTTDRLTVGAYLTEWLELQRARVEPSTASSYAGVVANHLVPSLGTTTLEELRVTQIEALYARLLVDPGPRGRPLSLRTVRYVHAVLHKALADAVRTELLARNVADRATVPKRDHGRPQAPRELRCWTAEQLRAFLDQTAGSPYGLLWRVAAATGLRRGELLGLRWDDLDLDGRTLTVRRALTFVDGEPRFKRPKTSRTRTLRLDTTTLGFLALHRVAAEGDACGLVFNHEGEPIDPMTVTLAFRQAVARSGLPRIRLHDLRHTHATLLLAGGVPVKVVSERLGHATIALTLDIYAHVLPAMDGDAADRFGALLDDPDE